ncbi:leucyl aminopeptidase [Zavarzinella formosa]|uniref:leucyl aminopeptidase n=1 Tax=Zavarzinella formosa TaxID=360055 RepID=UPI0002D3A3C7|nr:leucyl aminopeptidase [Zavarzinella formosa]
MTNRPFRFSSGSSPLSQVEADWLIVPVVRGQQLEPAVKELDATLGGDISKLLEAGDLTGKQAELVTLHRPGQSRAKRIMFVGCGPYPQITRASLHAAIATAFRSFTSRSWEKIAVHMPADVGLATETEVLAVTGGAAQGSVGPGLCKKDAARFVPGEIVLVTPTGSPALPHGAVRRGSVEAECVTYARELVNLPPSDLFPESFAARAGACGKNISCEIWDEPRLIAERMGAVLGVARGSARPPRFVVLRYLQGGTSPALALVGKGVTFDSGGLSLKTNDQMADMKGDMAGAAAVLAAIKGIAELKPEINVVGYVPLVENMPGSQAMKLGDVLVARNGKTIEVLNTDAEGRLILADALSYAAECRPGHIVDLATLTGACMVALGTQIAGLMSNNIEWSDRVRVAISRAGERAWALPMDTDFEELLQSKVADLKNTPQTRYGGAIAAGKFLEQFVDGIPWVHLDIAGPAWADHDSPSRDAGGTGAYVHSLIELALSYRA